MLKYFIKRVLYSALALLILLLLVFFLMQAIPGFPITKSSSETDAEFTQRVQSLGLLDNIFVQLWNFIVNLFVHGQFGVVYNESISVTSKMLEPIQYTLMIAGPAFVLSSIFGIILGVISAYYRGKWQDILINGISVLFISIPSFVFALYLIKLAGLIGLPTQFHAIGSGYPPSEIILSMIMPILSMTLASISTVTYYTRNELVEIFKQDYIRIALSKGYKFRQVIFKYAMRNALIPIIACLLPSFLGILSGSIIIEKFFSVPGTASILIDAINGKQIYVVMFAAVFYGAIYFILQIFVDMLYTIIDPRIVLSEKKADSLYNKIKFWCIRKRKINLLSNVNKNYIHLVKKNVNNIQNEESYIDSDIGYMQNDYEINDQVDQCYNLQAIETENYNLQYIDKSLFQNVDISKVSNEQIAGKPTRYITDVAKRFFKSKSALIFTIILGLIIALSLIISIANINTLNDPISSTLPSSFYAYLPPRIPWLGVSGVTDYVVSSDTFQAMQKYAELHGVKLWDSYVDLGTSIQLIGYNPYVLPELKNCTLMLGTDGLGRNWWNLLWFSTIQSLVFALIVAIPSIIIGTIYGGIAGSKAGTWIDNVLMRIVEILSGVPLILWIMILGIIMSGGNISMIILGVSLILVNWMGPAVTARTYILKYKDAEFVQAAKTLGASQTRILFTHMLPNISGRLFVRLVNMIPRIIFFESSLVFLGLKSSTELSLGTMIETARLNSYPWLLIGPTLMIVLITLCAQIISNNLNDALDPKVSGD